ncbi:MAG: DUF6178 family protein [Planctomycetota bacterium]|nr:DUF6178 family protein [Planctomycetota bacterium]
MSSNEPQSERPTGAGADAHPLAARAREILNLSKTDLRAAESAFELMGFEAQLDTALALEGDELQDWLLLAEDCTELVRALPPEHLHHSIRLIGAEDALSVLQAASSGQLQALLDVEFYTDHKLDRKKVRRWVELLLELNPDEADEALQGLDGFAIATYLRRYVASALRDEQIQLALQMKQVHLVTPDRLLIADDLAGRFAKFLHDEAPDLYEEILERIFLDDPRDVRSDMYAGREERMEARGFPARERAEALLHPVDLEPYAIAWPEAEAGAATAALATSAAPAGPFLAQALAWGRARGELGEKTERAFIKEAAEIANMLLLAHTRDPGEPQAKKEALAAVQVVGSAGLEAVTSGHLPAATEALKSMDLLELFRLGWTLIRSVARPAWEMAADPRLEDAQDGDGPKWLGRELRDAILEAEILMDWRQLAAGALPASERDPDRPPPPPLLSWPRLAALHLRVEAARTKFEERYGVRPGTPPGDPTLADDTLKRLR